MPDGQIVIRIPAAMVMTNVAGFGVHGIFCAPLITDVVVLFLSYAILIIQAADRSYELLDRKAGKQGYLRQ